MRAGSSRSMWLVVMMVMRPSMELPMPSKAFSKPLQGVHGQREEEEEGQGRVKSINIEDNA